MADLANLRISVDSRDVTSASQNLNKMAGAADGAEAAIRDVGSTATRTSSAVSGMNSAIQQGAAAQAAAANAMRAVGQTGQLASHQITNLAFQFQDLAVQIASGSNPLIAFAQQGSQVSGIMMQSGMSAKQFGVALLSLIGILKTTSDAQLDAAAASSAATAARFRALNAQAAEAVLAAQAEIALATAQLENAASATATKVATDRLTAAQDRLADAQLEASATAQVLSVAQTEAAAASTAAGNATRLAIGPVAPILAAVAVAATGVAAAFSFLSEEFNKSGEVEAYAKSIGLTAKEIDKAGGASITAGDMVRGLWMTISEGLNLGAVFETLGRWFRAVGSFAIEAGKIIYTAFAGTFSAIKNVFSSLPAVFSDLFVQAANKAITAVNVLLNKIVDGINALAGTTLLDPIKFTQIANQNAGAAQKAGAVIGQSYADAYAEAGAGLALWGANSAKAAQQRMDEQKKEDKARKEGRKAASKQLTDAQKELKQLTEQTDEYIKSLSREIEAIGKTAKELRALEVARARDNAQKALSIALAEGDDKEVEAIKQKIEQLNILEAAREAALNVQSAEEAVKEYNKVEDEIRKLNKEVEHEISLLGLSGAAREEAALAFEQEAIAAEYAAKGIERSNEELQKYLNKRRELAAGETALERDAQAALRLANNLEAAAGMLGQGGLGAITQNLLKLEVEFAPGETKKISEALAKEFPKLAGVIGNALVGAQFGGMAGGVLGSRGSKMGSQVGGALASALGGDVLGKMLGKFSKLGGPIAGIAGGIIGGLVGGMLKKTPKASATVSIAGGDALMAGVTGSKKLQGVATGLANGLIKGLGDIAGALGGELGGAVRLSIGQRKDKFTVDLSGQGRTKGVPTFNTEAEAIAFAMRHAITQGAITGISAGAQALLRAGGDLNAQLQKALAFDKVFDDLRRELDPAGAALDDLAREMEKLKAIFAEAGASSADYAKLEELFAIRRAKVLFDANRPRRELEIQLMEAQGDAAGALAARRKLELESMDANLRGLQEQIWAAEDANKAAQAVIEANEKAAREAEEAAEAAKRLAADRRSLEIELMEALGKSSEALAARRQMELEAMDESLRGLQQQIWAALDAKEAAEAAAEAARAMAEEQARAAEAAERIAADRRRLEIELLEALGNSTEALAARRQLELAAMDESLRALQNQIWAALDARAASEAAAEATRVLAEEQARAAEVAATLAAERRELEIQLLEAQGLALEALTARRAMELDATDASLRSLRAAIFAAQDKAEADAAAARAAEEAAAAEAKAAEDAANAMQQYMDTLTDVTKTVTEEINRLRGINASSTSVLLKAQFATLTAQARTGNLDALGKLPELSRSIEEATIGSASSALEVARIRAWLSASLSETLAAQSASNAEVNTTGAGLIFDSNQTTTASGAQTADAISNMRGDLYNALYQIAKNTGKSYELMDRWDGDGLPDIREDESDYY